MSKFKCHFKNCGNDFSRRVSLFHFPIRDKDRCLEWILRSGNDKFIELPDKQLRNRKICAQHFPVDAFRNVYKNSLNPSAVPHFYHDDEDEVPKLKTHDFSDSNSKIAPTDGLNHSTATNSNDVNEVEVSTMEDSNSSNDGYEISQNTSYDNELNDTSQVSGLEDALQETISKYQLFVEGRKLRKVKLIMKKKQKANEDISKETLLSELGKHVTGAPLVLFQMQLKNSNLNSWEKDEKELALTMFGQSPKLYKSFMKMGFNLPSEHLIRNWIKSSTINICP